MVRRVYSDFRRSQRALWMVLAVTLLMLLAACQEGDATWGTEDASREVDVSRDSAELSSAPDHVPVTVPESPDASQEPETDTLVTKASPVETQDMETVTAPEEVLTLAPLPETEPVDTSEVQEQVMPRLDIVTQDGRNITSKETYVTCTVSMSHCAPAYAFSEVSANIRVRGNSTAAGAKKPYRLKFDTKRAMLDLHDGYAFKNWCLMADYYDASLLRTYATFQMAEALLDGCVYSSDCAHVEVYVNGTYQGVYLLCEQTQIHKNRVNIFDKKDEDTSLEVGYLMIGQGGRFDEPGNIRVYPDLTIKDRNGQTMHYGSMNFALQGSEYTEAQKEYCSTYVSAVFQVIGKALYQNEFYELARDGTMTRRSFPAGMTLRERQIQTIDAVFNIESAVRLCILDEIVKNLDAMTFNMYVDLSPTGDGRLTLAAPWDFDFAIANTHYSTTHATSGFYATNFSYSDGVRVNPFYVMFGSIDWFDEMVQEVWKQKYAELRAAVEDVRAESLRYADALNRDFARWERPLGGTFSHHCMDDLVAMKEHGDAAYFVYNWLSRRLTWLNRQWGDGEDQPVEASPLLDVDLTQAANQAYFTGYHHCTGSITPDGLYLTQEDAYDPFVYLDFTSLEESFEAEDYPYLEITCMIPNTNARDDYVMELFLCSGSLTNAVAECRTQLSLVRKDGQYHTYRVDLSGFRFWSGQINKIRIDFFAVCEPGDSMYIKHVALRTE